MPGRIESNQTILDQAAYWTTLVNGDGFQSEEQRQSFHAWLDVPCNARAFQEYRSILSMIQDLPKEQAADLVALCQRSWFSSLTALFEYPLSVSVAAAALLAVAVTAAWLTLRPVRELVTQTYTTGIDEERDVVLPDGSLAHLNTRSRLRWIGAGKERCVVLEKGEVLFEVVHDPTRPFCVRVDNSEIVDLATQFDVYRKANGSVIVTVLSGKVAVKELTPNGMPPAWIERLLKPNEQIEYTPAALVADVHSVSAAKVVRWREGFLETEGQSFSAIVSELNRYSVKPILIADPRLLGADFDTGHRFSMGGSFNIHNIPESIEHIRQLEPVVITDTGDSYVLSYKVDASASGSTNAISQNAAGQP